MIDSDGWKPAVFMVIILVIAGIAVIGRTFVMDLFGYLLVALVVGLGLFIIIQLIKSGSENTGWTRPTAKRRTGAGGQVEVTGNTEQLSREGIAGVRHWEHVGYKKWELHLGKDVDPQDVIDNINNARSGKL